MLNVRSDDPKGQEPGERYTIDQNENLSKYLKMSPEFAQTTPPSRKLKLNIASFLNFVIFWG